MAATESHPRGLARSGRLARHHQFVRTALQTAHAKPERNRKPPGAGKRAETFAGAPNARSEPAPDRPGLFGNNRPRPARPDEGWRNHFPPRSGAKRKTETQVGAVHRTARNAPSKPHHGAIGVNRPYLCISRPAN